MYAKGQGVPQDYAEAVKWFRKAGDQGYDSAMPMLGISYALGKGVRKDSVQSYFWFSLAASRSSGDDYKQLSESRDIAARQLTPEKLREAQRMTQEWEASHPRK